MAEFRVIDPHGAIVAIKNFAGAEAAYAWFIDSIADDSELGWRMEVNDDGQWAFFDDTEGFTAPVSPPSSTRLIRGSVEQPHPPHEHRVSTTT